MTASLLSHDWRLPFLLVAIPSFVCAMLMLFTMKEPERGDQEHAVRELRKATMASAGGETVHAADPRERVPSAMDDDDDTEVAAIEYKPNPTLASALGLFKRTPLLMFLQGLPGCLPWGLV
jgi:hypothetical protein